VSGVQLTREGRGLERAAALISGLTDPRRQAEGLAAIGALVESQSKARFDERRSPEGDQWPAWSAGYAASRARGHSLLVASGALRDSIAWELDADELAIGTNLVYGAIHQFGGTEDMPAGPAAIPAREYLGVSEDNETEILDALETWIGGMLH
jgi:phage virion morphogenesis protein